MSGGRAFPCLESRVEGIGVIIAKQEGGLVDFNRGPGSILVDHFLLGLGQEWRNVADLGRKNRLGIHGDVGTTNWAASPLFLKECLQNITPYGVL